jgi:chromosome segregation ATPase
VSDTNPALAEVEDQIAVLEDNLHNLTEQAAAYSGAGDEDLSSDRIAELEQQLEALKKQRDQLA